MIIYTPSDFYISKYRVDDFGRPITKKFDRQAWNESNKYLGTVRQELELEQFKAICTARQTRDFELVLCLEVSGSMVEHAMMALKDDLDAHKDEEVCRLLSGTPIISMIPRTWKW